MDAATSCGCPGNRQGEMNQGNVVQAAPVKRQSLTTNGGMVCCRCPRSAHVRQALQATQQPGLHPTAEPENSDHRQGSLISDNARRESRRNTRQKNATTSASPAKRLGWARLTSRERGGGSNR